MRAVFVVSRGAAASFYPLFPEKDRRYRPETGRDRQLRSPGGAANGVHNASLQLCGPIHTSISVDPVLIPWIPAGSRPPLPDPLMVPVQCVYASTSPKPGACIGALRIGKRKNPGAGWPRGPRAVGIYPTEVASFLALTQPCN